MPIEIITYEVQSPKSKVQSLESEIQVDDIILAENGFYWREKDGVKVLVCAPLENAGFVNGFSTRIGGVSDLPANSLNLAGYDEDSAENIAENRRRFLSLFDGEWK
ncbi:MAG: laccase domain-containing protein, partial [Pyrinomonadaceae bacterium]|nr:laccase domain-containing protein [Pyrinomonadaceae bacterium]